jgi:hypothetical protein
MTEPVSPTSRCPKCDSSNTRKMSQTYAIAGIGTAILGVLLSPIFIGLLFSPAVVYFWWKAHTTKDSEMHCKVCGTQFRLIGRE